MLHFWHGDIWVQLVCFYMDFDIELCSNDRAEEEIITGVCIVISVCSLTHYNQTPHFREYDRVNSSETLVLTSPRDIPFSGSTSRTSPAKWRHDYLTSFFFSFFLLLFFFSFSTFPQRFWILKQPYTPGMMARWGSSAWRHMMLFLIAYVLIQSTRACVCVSYQLWWYEEIIYIYIFYIGWRCWCTEKKTQLIGNTWCKYRNELWTAQLLRFAKKEKKATVRCGSCQGISESSALIGWRHRVAMATVGGVR